MTLVIPSEGCCKGHPCDNCATCQKGRCCRHDNPDYRLPELGEWDGPIYGELGVLNDDGEKVECHCCGEWFVRLARHLRISHDVTVDEYKAMFGLARGQGLVSRASHEKQSKSWHTNVKPHISLLTGNLMTPEQNAAQASRPRRLQITKTRVENRELFSDIYSKAAQGVKHGSSSGYRGVSWDKTRGMWQVSLMYRGRQYHLGRYPTAALAACAYDRKAHELYGDNARLNFPDEPL